MIDNTFLSEMEVLLSTYCKDCFLHKQIVIEHGRKSAHRFCITQCTVGEQLKKIGKTIS